MIRCALFFSELMSNFGHILEIAHLRGYLHYDLPLRPYVVGGPLKIQF